MQTVTLRQLAKGLLLADRTIRLPPSSFKTGQDTTTNYLVYAHFRSQDVRDNHLEDTMLYFKRFFTGRLAALSGLEGSMRVQAHH